MLFLELSTSYLRVYTCGGPYEMEPNHKALEAFAVCSQSILATSRLFLLLCFPPRVSSPRFASGSRRGSE